MTLSQSPSGPYFLGTTEVVLTATDDDGNSATCTATVTIEDRTPPEVSVSLDPSMLWPPDHRMIDVTAAVVAHDNCGSSTILLTSLSSNEPSVNDIQGADIGIADFRFKLRAERAGSGNGRRYTIVYTVTDGDGNTRSVSADILVPHDKR